jgi:hypothetical protein
MMGFYFKVQPEIVRLKVYGLSEKDQFYKTFGGPSQLVLKRFISPENQVAFKIRGNDCKLMLSILSLIRTFLRGLFS